LTKASSVVIFMGVSSRVCGSAAVIAARPDPP
jgi:uncharacterized membrane protein YadS